MLYVPKHFEVQELVCPHVYKKWGYNPNFIWNFFDPRLLKTLDYLRDKLNKPIFVNNWSIGGQFSQRGCRCNLCDLVKSKTNSSQIYVSSHILGKACDFDVKGMSAQEVRNWLISHSSELPFSISLEDKVNWVHLDMREQNNQKVYLFKV